MKANILLVLRNLHNDESGQDLIEYALIAAMIAFGAMASMAIIGTKITSIFSKIGSNLGAV